MQQFITFIGTALIACLCLYAVSYMQLNSHVQVTNVNVLIIKELLPGIIICGLIVGISFIAVDVVGLCCSSTAVIGLHEVRLRGINRKLKLEERVSRFEDKASARAAKKEIKQQVKVDEYVRKQEISAIKEKAKAEAYIAKKEAQAAKREVDKTTESDASKKVKATVAEAGKVAGTALKVATGTANIDFSSKKEKSSDAPSDEQNEIMKNTYLHMLTNNCESKGIDPSTIIAKHNGDIEAAYVESCSI